VRFEVQLWDRPATVTDFVVMRTVGDQLQKITWMSLVRTVARAAGSHDAGVQSHTENVDPSAAEVEEWLEGLAQSLRRRGAEAEIEGQSSEPRPTVPRQG
jgi:hypothetical protein